MWIQPVAHIAAYYAAQYSRTKYPALRAIMAAQMALYRAMSRCKRSATPTKYGTVYSFANPRYL